MNTSMKGLKMKKLVQNIVTLAVIFTSLLSVSGNAQALENNQTTSTAVVMPVQQAVIYQAQTVPYDNFNAAIFAEGQLQGEASKLPNGSSVAFYVDSNKVNGPVGLQVGTRCTAVQANADYYKNTITMDRRFCLDFNDAILDGRSVYGMVPDESVFIHKVNGERCYETGNGGAVYLVNPASPFVRNYLVHRGAEKMDQLGVNTFFLDNLQPGLGGITQRCGGNPMEYPVLNDYVGQIVEMARNITESMPNYRIQGNLSNASPTVWSQFSFLNGAMCESCFSSWGSWPTAAKMLSVLSVMNTWINQAGRDVYIVIQSPDILESSNRFAFAASLLVARNDGKGVYFHFGRDYGKTYLLPEYKYDLGLPTAAYVCSGYICTRTFERGMVRVDFEARQGLIMLSSSPMTPTSTSVLLSATSPTSTPTLILPTMTNTMVPPTVTITSSPTPVPPTVTKTASPVPTIAFTQTAIPTLLAPTSLPVTMPTGQNSVTVRISNGSNDAEENSQGKMYINSTDLELVYDTSSQVIGMRFVGVNIPAGATIVSAAIQFKVDEVSSQNISLKIQGEASANASAFTSATRNISSRFRTKNFVTWAPPSWSVKREAGAKQMTPNLAPIIQEIVSQPGWVSGNSLVVIITGSTGKRIAKAFEGDAAGAPLLHIEYNNGTTLLTNTATLTTTATMTATMLSTASPTATFLPPTESQTVTPTPTEYLTETSSPVPSPTAIIPPAATDTAIPIDTPLSTPTP